MEWFVQSMKWFIRRMSFLICPRPSTWFALKIVESLLESTKKEQLQTNNYKCWISQIFHFLWAFFNALKDFPINKFRSRERRKLHFRESNFTDFLEVYIRQLNHCIRYFQMLPKPLTSYNVWLKYQLVILGLDRKSVTDITDHRLLPVKLWMNMIAEAGVPLYLVAFIVKWSVAQIRGESRWVRRERCF